MRAEVFREAKQEMGSYLTKARHHFERIECFYKFAGSNGYK
jgi:hypothetical protein